MNNGATGETLRKCLLNIAEANKRDVLAFKAFEESREASRLAAATVMAARTEFGLLLAEARPEAVAELDELMGFPFGDFFRAIDRK